MKRIGWFLLVLMVVPFLAGCDPVVEIRVVTGRDLTATSQVSSIAAGPVASPTARRLPTPTRPRPTATVRADSGAVRIRFRTGATSATVSGQLGPRGSSLYILNAAAGQTMEVSVAPTQSGVSFTIWGQDGTVLKQGAEDRAEFVLPSAQDYYVALYAGEEATAYSLTVTISALGSSGPAHIAVGLPTERASPGAAAPGPGLGSAPLCESQSPMARQQWKID